MLIEACIDDLLSARHAATGGAGRVELCDNLADGGTTPSHGLIAHLLERSTIPVFPIVRVRGGGFSYSADELDVMRRDVAEIAHLGAPGVVIGALTAEGDVDQVAMARLRDAAADMSVTFHRAFDHCRDPYAALDTLITLGIDRVLTSGQCDRAWDGRELIGDLVEQAGGRISIMAGGGISEQDVEALVQQTGVEEIHVRATMVVRDTLAGDPQSLVPFRRALPGDESARLVTDPQRIAAIRKLATRGAGVDSG
jgi:copper homeostasis protein